MRKKDRKKRRSFREQVELQKQKYYVSKEEWRNGTNHSRRTSEQDQMFIKQAGIMLGVVFLLWLLVHLLS